MVQGGSPSTTEMVEVMVVEGTAVACSSTGKPVLRQAETLQLAELTAVVLNAQVIGVRIAQLSSRVVVWDVNPVPEFRALEHIGTESVAVAIGKLVAKRQPASSKMKRDPRGSAMIEQSTALQEVAHGVVLSA